MPIVRNRGCLSRLACPDMFLLARLSARTDVDFSVAVQEVHMHKMPGAASLLLCSLACGPLTNAQGSFPRLLPAAEDFHLTLREDRQSKLPLGPSCSREMLLTLSCSAFTLTLENRSAHTVRISELSCADPGILFMIKPPGYTGAWFTISRPGRPTCYPPEWVNIRLKPGEKTEYTTRIISPQRDIEGVSVGAYALRAEWALAGCTESPEGTDCLAPLQATRPGNSISNLAFQEPVTLVSNEITAGSPGFPDLGDLNLAFEVTVVPGEKAKSKTGQDCSGDLGRGIDCTVFHYAVRNLANRAVRIMASTCPGFIPNPEYRFGGSDWKSLPNSPNLVWTCDSTMTFETPILPGGASEGNFTLRRYDTSLLQASGEYRVRFTFVPGACIASPDGRFCVTRPENQPTVTSTELTLPSPEASSTRN
jgi:hypothetical protein